MVDWNWDRAGQFALTGGAGGAMTGNPLFAGLGAAGGFFLGGLLPGGAAPLDNPYATAPPPPTYNWNVSPSAIGGQEKLATEFGPSADYQTAGGMTDEELLTWAIENPSAAASYGIDPNQLGAYDPTTWSPAAAESLASKIRGQMPPDAVTSGQMVPTRYETWADVQGQQEFARGGSWIGAGLDLERRGLEMQDRGPIELGTQEIDRARDVVSMGGTNVENVGRQMGQDRLALQDQLGGIQQQMGADRAAMSGQFDTGMSRAQGAYNTLGNRINEGMTRGRDAYGDLGSQLDYMRQVQHGEAGPSLAETMSNRLLGEQIANQMAMAKSGSSFTPAAQRQAALSGEQMAAQQRQQLAELRAQEQMRAQGQVSNLAQAQQQAALGLGQYGLAGGQAQQQAALGMGQYGLQGTQALAGLTGQQGDLALQAGQANLGYLGQQGNLAMGARGQEMGLLGQEMGFAGQQAGFADAQRARDDMMRMGLIGAGQRDVGLGMGMQGQAFNMMNAQAQMNLNQYLADLGASNAAAEGAWRAQAYNNALAQQNADRWMQGFGTVAMAAPAVAGSFGGGQAPGGQAPTPTYGGQVNPAPQGTGVTNPSTPQGTPYTGPVGPVPTSEAPLPSDERTKKDLESARRQIDSLTRALADAQTSEQKLAAASGYLDHVSRETALRGVTGAMVTQGEAEAMDRSLAGLSRQTPQQWKYTPEARAAFPAAGPGQRIGYTTQQLKSAGPAGAAMVQTDPTTGYEVLDPGAVGTFSLGAIGQQQQRLDDQQAQIDALTEELERSRTGAALTAEEFAAGAGLGAARGGGLY